MMLNTCIYEEINKRDAENTVFDRIVKLIRTDGMIDEKKILAALSPDIHESEINRRISEQKLDAQVYRYGVKIMSQEWSDIAKYALEASSVVDAMDKVGKGLSQLTDAVEEEDQPSLELLSAVTHPYFVKT